MSSALKRVEEIVNEYAREQSKKLATGIKPSQIQVLLVKGKSFNFRVLRGNPVSIILPWPEAQVKINTILREAFTLIRERKLVDCIEVGQVMYTRSRGDSKKKWYREQFGVESELIAELIGKREIKIETITETVTTTVMRDLITGVEIRRVEPDKKIETTDGRHIDLKSWLELSRMANEYVDALPDPEPTPVEVASDVQPVE